LNFQLSKIPEWLQGKSNFPEQDWLRSLHQLCDCDA
jgi:hypothetical protein